MKQQKDIYDLEVERLTREPGLIEGSWMNAEPLFRMIGDGCTCLTMIRAGEDACDADGEIDYKLTSAIQADAILPPSSNITPAHLPHFAKWQRRIDRMNAGESFEDVMKNG